MNVLYILGNGFDKAQGMKTSYPEFYQYLMDNTNDGSPLLQQLKKDINADKELWSDMEEAFGQFTSKIKTEVDMENLYFELSECLQKYLKSEQSTFKPDKELITKFQNDFVVTGKYLGATDKNRYTNFVKSMPGGKDISVMTLNYTNTLETLLNLGNATDKNFGNNNYFRQVIHVHGQLDDSIIIGVDNESQILNEAFRNNDNIKDFLVKIQSNLAMKYTRHTVCEELIKTANLIVIFGVSLGNTDERWWRLIGEQFKSRNNLSIIQYLYEPKAVQQTRKQLLGRIERRQRNVLMERLGFEKQEDWPKDTLNRLYFIINSDAFK